MSKLIALIDGSVYSESVCDHAAWAAQRTQAEVELLHVLGRRQTASAPTNLSGSIALGARTQLLEELSELDAKIARLSQERGRAILDDAMARLKEDGVDKVAARLRFGDLLEAIEETSDEAGMVMLGKRGEAADFASLHLGSNLERVARSSKLPVFVASRAFRPIKRVLIAYDGGASSMKAVDYVSRSLLFDGLEIRLLFVGADTPETQRKLDAAKALLGGGGHHAEAAVVSGQPDKAIAEAVEQGGVDMLVMGAYGHSRIRSLVIGSTTSAMIRLCKVPVLLFR